MNKKHKNKYIQSAATRRAHHRAWLVTCHSKISKIDDVLGKQARGSRPRFSKKKPSSQDCSWKTLGKIQSKYRWNGGPERTKNQYKMIQKPTPGGVPHRLGGALKGSWALLGGSWAWNSNYDDFCLIFLRVLGSSWGRLGAQDGRLGGQDDPKILPRRPMMPLRCLQDSPRSDFDQKKRKKWTLRARMAFSIRF